MAAGSNVVQDKAISHEIIDGLEEGLERLKKFDGRFYSPHSSSSFWFSTTEGKRNEKGRKLDDDATLEEYQYTLRRYRLASKALLDMSRSFELEIHQMELEIQPTVLSRGIAKIPDEILALVMRSLYEPWDPSEKVKPQPEDLRLVNKRFKDVVDSQPFLHSFLASDMSLAEVSRRLDRTGTHVGLKIHLDDTHSNFCKFVDSVIPTISRWEEVYFDYEDLSDDNVKRAYTKLENLTFPRLVRFLLRLTEGGEAQPVYSKWKTPLLDEVVCYGGIPSGLGAKKAIKSLEFVVDDLGWDVEPGYLNRLSEFLVATTSLTSLQLCIGELEDEGASSESRKIIQLPNLKKLDLYFCFAEFDPNEDEMDRVDELGNALYTIISQLKTPELEQLVVTVEHDACWDDVTNTFLTDLFWAQAKSTNLRRIEFTQKGTPLEIGASSLLNILRNLHLEGTAVLAGISFEEGSTERLAEDMSKEAPRNLRRLHLKDCSVSANDLRVVLKVFTKRNIYPKFEALALTRCSGFKRDMLRGTEGLEHLCFEDE